MHLNKWFNGKFLWQNIKKSKMTLAMFFVLVPIFTTLVIIANENEAFDFISLAAINLIGMYVIPFIFSISLFGFVFKKNSADFMGSMPISRKCLFITNTIGGIGLIVIMQLITFLLTLLVSCLTTNVIFVSMAWDIFLFQTVAYIFVFAIANLAMSVSGNLMTQIAVTLLIVFLVPFTVWTVEGFADYYGEDYSLMHQKIEIMELEKIRNFTAPFFVANERYEYNSSSMLKMILLSLLYIGIGYYAFTRKKLEVAGESFEKPQTHFIVKGLTLIPFVAILKGIAEDASLSVMLIVLAIIAVYYFLFDLITGKKMKVWQNLMGMIVSVTVLFGVYSVTVSLDEKMEHSIDLSHMKRLEVEVSDWYYLQFTDPNEIEEAVVTLAKAEKNQSYSYKRTYYVKLYFTSCWGTHFEKRVWLDGETLSTWIDSSYPNLLMNQNVVISDEKYHLTKQEEEAVMKAVNESLRTLTIKDFVDSTENERVSYDLLSFYQYQNHRFIDIAFPIVLDAETQKIVMQAANRYAVQYLKYGGRDYYYSIDLYNLFGEEMRQKVYFFTSEYDSHELLENFILSHQNETPQNMRKCIRISDYQFKFYTEDVQGFIQMIDEFIAKHPEEYKEWNTRYDDDYYYYKYNDDAVNEPVSVPITMEEE